MLLRKDLERRLKKRLYSLQTVGYGWVRMENGGQKRVAWDGDTERLVQKKSFWLKKGRLLRIARKGLYKWKVFGL